MIFDSGDTGSSGVDTGDITKSLRFRAIGSTYMSRTFGTPTAATTWTFSLWVKRGTLSTSQDILWATGSEFYFASDDTLRLYATAADRITTTAKFRDPSSWLHIVLSNNANAITLYVNNQSVGTYTGSTTFNTAIAHNFGRNGGGSGYLDGYGARVCWVDNAALTPSSFGYLNTEINEWVTLSRSACKAVVDAGGTNSFMLDFEDGTSLTTLGNDYSAKNNDWTLNNHSLTAGVTYDWMEDRPGNSYAVWTPLKKSTNINYTNGNLSAAGSAGTTHPSFVGVVMSTQKWYSEHTVESNDGTGYPQFGLIDMTISETVNASIATTKGISYSQVGNIMKDGVNVLTGRPAFTNSDVISVAFDADTGKVWFAKNGTWVNGASGTAGNPAAGTHEVATVSTATLGYTFGGNAYNIASFSSTFGQRPFTFSAPTGFLPLCQQNLP